MRLRNIRIHFVQYKCIKCASIIILYCEIRFRGWVEGGNSRRRKFNAIFSRYFLCSFCFCFGVFFCKDCMKRLIFTCSEDVLCYGKYVFFRLNKDFFRIYSIYFNLFCMSVVWHLRQSHKVHSTIRKHSVWRRKRGMRVNLLCTQSIEESESLEMHRSIGKAPTKWKKHFPNSVLRANEKIWKSVF